ncbi:D-amino acid dehydrogenase [Alkalilimnicola sp. S0819]|uniref:D-amino acid dehydrogenase n=1 Tax=Alkalilimnicola sp. S0819 TaxID=2613922 RepID=UPI001262631D|nr:D-amino acid dehydrogenase [Alkalilimnicola sp. S0819]KAB7627270.1 FAD-dependent oxidoreductase [Alkalilimnicola sp. S0819]MPQ15983.1 FAD-dependent oxidoreductase [Alkalilimnicola sp. S0819]
MRILVMGGGLMGTATAYYLAEAGHAVTLLDRQTELAGEGSHANGGMLHAGHTAPWNTPDAIRQLLRWGGRKDSPLLLRPGQIPRLIPWGLQFLRYSRAPHHAHSTRLNTRLAVYSLRQMQALRPIFGADYRSARRGILKLFHDRQQLARALRGSTLTEALGVRYTPLDTDAVVALEPALAGTAQRIAGGILYPDDESGDARLFTLALGERLRAWGAELRLGERIRRIEGDAGGIDRVITDRGELSADAYVMAAGVDAPALLRPLGLRLPIQPVKGYSATLPADEGEDVPRMPIIDEAQKVVITPLGQQLRIAGMAEFAGMDRTIHAHRVKTLIRQSLANFPAFAARAALERAEHWACLRPVTMDGPPILGASGIPGLYLNTGAGHLGWTYAAGAGRVVADCVMGHDPEIDLTGLTLARFGRATGRPRRRRPR